jgi:hypothetical protein
MEQGDDFLKVYLPFMFKVKGKWSLLVDTLLLEGHQFFIINLNFWVLYWHANALYLDFEI